MPDESHTTGKYELGDIVLIRGTVKAIEPHAMFSYLLCLDTNQSVWARPANIISLHYRPIAIAVGDKVCLRNSSSDKTYRVLSIFENLQKEQVAAVQNEYGHMEYEQVFRLYALKKVD